MPFSIVRPTWIFGGPHEILANNIAWILRHVPLFAIPGNGEYPVQPVHVDDLARLCVQSSHGDSDVIIDAAGPQNVPVQGPPPRDPNRRWGTWSRAARPTSRDGARGPCARATPRRRRPHTRREIAGLQAGLLISHQPPLGIIPFTDWLAQNADILGRTYANELRRHYSEVIA